MNDKKICPHCKKEFLKESNAQKYCSENCRIQAIILRKSRKKCVIRKKSLAKWLKYTILVHLLLRRNAAEEVRTYRVHSRVNGTLLR